MRLAHLFAALSPWERLYRPGRELIRDSSSQFRQAVVLVQVFQGLILFHSLTRHSAIRSVIEPPEFDPLWPVAWLTPAAWPTAVKLMSVGLILASFLSTLFPFSRLARAITFLLLFQIESVFNSYIKISHDNHVLILTAFVFVWLPGIGGAREKVPPEETRLRFLEVFWGAQMIALLTYSLAGLSKIRGAWQATLRLDRSVLAPDGLATILAADFINTGKTTVLGIGEFIVAHPPIGWPLLIGVIALEFLALPVAWTPRLHRLWGAGLMGLHMGIALVMEVFFLNVLLVLGILLLASPFAPRAGLFDFRLRDLPWLGPFLDALAAEIRVQRRRGRRPAAELAAPDFTMYFDERRPKQVRWSKIVCNDDGWANIGCRSRDSKEFQRLSDAYPSLSRTNGIVAATERDRGIELRVGMEAILWTAAHLRAPGRRILILLLLVPLPLLDAAEAILDSSVPVSRAKAGLDDA